MGSKHDGKTRNWTKTLISVLWKFSMKPEAREIFTVKIRIQSGFYQNYSAEVKIIGIDRGSKICRKDRNQTNGPRSSRWLNACDQNVVSNV